MCNFNVRFLLMFFFEICVCSFVNIARLSDESSMSSFYSIVALIVIISFTGFVISRIEIDIPKWNSEETIANPRYKTIYLGLYMKYSKVATMYPVLFLLRRIAYATIALTMTDSPLGQVFLYIIMSCCMLGLLWLGGPFEHRKTISRLQIFNEVCVLISGGILLTFSQILSSNV